jgi:[glutamine synthetase] adenylyltransferase / [glutamine synthetase]-adenylyl-L-tyrosine phosphorylase
MTIIDAFRSAVAESVSQSFEPEILKTSRLIVGLSEPQQAVFLQATPEPLIAYQRLEQFARFHREALAELLSQPMGLAALAQIFGHSSVLSDDLMQHPDWLSDCLNGANLRSARTIADFEEHLRSKIRATDPGEIDPFAVPTALTLSSFRRQSMVRILLRDTMGYATVGETTEELSALADAIVNVSVERLFAKLCRELGTPQLSGRRSADSKKICQLAVIALGKWGANELNYSSDIDLMFLYTGNGKTDGSAGLSNKEFFHRLANDLTGLLSAYTPEGFAYRVDLRLRPDGRAGDVAMSLDAAKTYYAERARDWELQMLIKGRAAAGDRQLGRELLWTTEPLTYATSLDFRAIESVTESRLRIQERTQVGRQTTNVKLSKGGIRDIEFLTQCLQRLHGGRESSVRRGSTLTALQELRDRDLLSLPEYAMLRNAYEFLRTIEHRLQILDDRQTHSLPVQAQKLASLARRMPSELLGGIPTSERLTERLSFHLQNVQVIYERLMQLPSTDSASKQSAESGTDKGGWQSIPAWLHANQQGRLTVNVIDALETLSERREVREQIERDTDLAELIVELFEHSAYFADALGHDPQAVTELREINAPHIPEELMQRAQACGDANELRALFQRELLRIHVAGFALRESLFRTLEKTSDLADAVIRATYELAIAAAGATGAGLPTGYQPLDQMMVIVLGRLGMREFDIASDADIIFVLPEKDADAALFWTRVAERMIEMLTAFSAAGTMFTVDTRLRPNGKAGALVQLDSSYRQYFDQQAEAWEGVAYMKARAVAGNREKAEWFLSDLQRIDWRRCGQSMRSRERLREMRSRIEKERGQQEPLKSGVGGFYDLDFVLMYLRLKSAGIYFPVLNTPARVDVIEKMGHLDADDATSLLRAATLFRAIDHALRFYSGHPEPDLPASPATQRLVTEIVARCITGYDRSVGIDEHLSRARLQARALFERVFQ